jgi:hypothetical protein
MNPYKTFSDVLFTCVDGPPADIANIFANGFNRPNQWTPRDALGVPIKRYFVKESNGSLQWPYLDRAVSGNPARIVFWEPQDRPGVTALMGINHDGLNHSVFRLSEDSSHTWVNVRIYDDPVYPGCFFDFYADRRSTERRLLATTNERGWDFAEKGPVQPFENRAYYSRRLIKDRLNRQIITEYLDKLGYKVLNDAFWEPTGSHYELWQERSARPPTPARSVSGSTPSSGTQAPPGRSW